MVTKDQILAALPKLSKADLDVIGNIVCHLQGHTAVLSEGAPEVPAACFNALAATVGAAMAIERLAPNLRKTFEGKYPPVIDFFNEKFKGWDETKILRLAFLKFVFELLKDDLIELKIGASITTMINNLHRIPKVIDNNYPGYSNGLGQLILNKLRPQHARMVKKSTEALECLLVSKGPS